MSSITRLPSSDRLGAEPQCTWVDHTCDAVERWLTHRQHDLLVATSRRNKPALGLMMAQVPRLSALGLAVGRYPTTVVRDVLLAVTTVLVDDQVVEPMLRMGLRVQQAQKSPAKPTAALTPLRMYQNTLGVIYGTGCAVLALPFNLAVVATAALGMTAGCLAGILWGGVAGLIAPKDLTDAMPRGLPILTHMAACANLVDQAQRYSPSAGSLPPSAEALHAALSELAALKTSYDNERQHIASLSQGQDPLAFAHAFDDALAAQPNLAQALGLTFNAPGVIDAVTLSDLDIEQATQRMEASLRATHPAPASFATSHAPASDTSDDLDAVFAT